MAKNADGNGKGVVKFCRTEKCGTRLRLGNSTGICDRCGVAKRQKGIAKTSGKLGLAEFIIRQAETGRRVPFGY